MPELSLLFLMQLKPAIQSADITLILLLHADLLCLVALCPAKELYRATDLNNFEDPFCLVSERSQHEVTVQLAFCQTV